MKIFLAVMGFWLGASVAWGDDLTTLTGRTYTNIVVQSYDAQGLFLRHEGGDTKVLFKEVLPELREHFKTMALNLAPAWKAPDETEAPAGANDLATLSGQIYRNVEVKRVQEHAVQIAHEGGRARVYFTDIPEPERERYRTAETIPDAPAGANDLVARNGQIFRNIEILRVEPDGLTFRHDGGATKLQFLALPPELREKHGYDPQAAREYRRARSAEKARALEVSKERVVVAPISVSEVRTEALADGKFRIRFAVRNLSDKPQSIRVLPYDPEGRVLSDGRKIRIPVQSGAKQLEIPVSRRPAQVSVFCGMYRTNCTPLP